MQSIAQWRREADIPDSLFDSDGASDGAPSSTAKGEDSGSDRLRDHRRQHRQGAGGRISRGRGRRIERRGQRWTRPRKSPDKQLAEAKAEEARKTQLEAGWDDRFFVPQVTDHVQQLEASLKMYTVRVGSPSSQRGSRQHRRRTKRATAGRAPY